MAKKNPGTSNLKPPRSTEEARERGRKGGLASGASRRQKAAMQELAKWVLDLPVKDAKLDHIKSLAGVKGKNVTVEEAAVLQQAAKAVGGNLQALQFLRDTAGEKPVERLEVNADVEEAEAAIALIVKKAKGGGKAEGDA